MTQRRKAGKRRRKGAGNPCGENGRTLIPQLPENNVVKLTTLFFRNDSVGRGMRNEKEGILLWALEGLHRLIQNNYQFTISERTAANLKEAMEQGNNILGFLKSEGYFGIRQGTKCKSTDFYKVYERWCLDNLEKPLAASTFIHHLKDNQKSLGIVYDDKCIGTNRGFHNVDIDLFLPVNVPSPWD